MGDETKIEWTDHTLNPWIGCSRVSPGCEHCYAETQANFRKSWGVTWGPSGNRRMASETTWRKPVVWNRKAEKLGQRKRVFCASLADVFEEGRWPELQNGRARLFDLIEKTPLLDWQLLTKRPQNVMKMVPDTWREAFPRNVWIGATVEDQKRAEERIPWLLEIPAAVRFLSCEPLLEAVNLESVRPYYLPPETPFDPILRVNALTGHVSGPDEYMDHHVNWVIVGGESGGGARDFDLEWARSIVAQCKAAKVACFVKQLGASASDPVNGIAGASLKVHPDATGLISLRLKDRKGGDWNEWPEDLRVRQWPGDV